MDQIFAVTDWLIDNWAILAGALTVLVPPGWSLQGKFRKARVILLSVVGAMKDRVLSDTEIATSFWMIIAVVLGWGPGASTWVLNFAPNHQIARLKSQKFIEHDYRPFVRPDAGALPPAVKGS